MTYEDVPKGDTKELCTYLQEQPVAIAVDAEAWQFYFGGTFPKWACGDSLDHGVLLVGLDSNGNYIVKNSWGESWGNKGYITLSGNHCEYNTCGLADSASVPKIWD